VTGRFGPGGRIGRPWRPLAVAAALAACAAGLTGCRQPGFGEALATSLPPVHATLPAAAQSYLGVYEPTAPASFAQVRGFSARVRRKPNLVLYFSNWGEAFNAAFARTAYQNGAVPYIDIDPTKVSVAAIAAGLQDAFLRRYAASVRSYRHPVVISFGHEMNGRWYPWGYGHVPPGIFVEAWRHMVTIFRQSGADNVTWLWIVNHEAAREGPIQDWWPGDSYVNWVGIDGYYILPYENFDSIFGSTIAAVRKLTAKPLLISETAVGPQAGRAAKVPDLFAGVRRHHLLGLVWFDKPQHQGLQHQDWRIEGHAAAVRAFSQQARAYQLARPGGSST
jgi:mannan endo-1,4-beta-mannosidase